VADWPGLVRGTVRARARRRAALSVAAALSLVVASSAGVVWARDGERDSTLVVATGAPTPSVTPTAGPVQVDLQLAVGDGGFLVPAGVPLEVVASAELMGDAPAVIRELRVDGEAEAPDPSFLCPAPEGSPPEPSTQRSRRTWTRTLTPGEHTLSVEAVPGCGHTTFDGVGRVITVRAVDVEPTPTPTATRASSRTPGPSPEASYPPERNAVSIEVRVSPARPRVGEEVRITVIAQGDKGYVRFRRITFAGGTKGVQGSDYSCAPPQPVPPQRTEVREELTHVYEEAGEDGIHVEVDSACGYYQGSGQKTVFVTVDPADEPTAGPSPSPLPS
jgi:hypothetical protein